MHAHLVHADHLLHLALPLIDHGEDEFYAALQALSAPIYVTDADGMLTFYNKACVGFAGRRPAVGKDRWCVTWKLYTEDGEYLPHDQCPMAVAIASQQPVRGLTAVAERPDGTRVTFTPLPTPLFTAAGEFIGAVNMLIDVTEIRQIAELRAEAKRCRRLSEGVGDHRATVALTAMAVECEAKAVVLEAALLATEH